MTVGTCEPDGEGVGVGVGSGVGVWLCMAWPVTMTITSAGSLAVPSDLYDKADSVKVPGPSGIQLSVAAKLGRVAPPPTMTRSTTLPSTKSSSRLTPTEEVSLPRTSTSIECPTLPDVPLGGDAIWTCGTPPTAEGEGVPNVPPGLTIPRRESEQPMAMASVAPSAGRRSHALVECGNRSPQAS